MERNDTGQSDANEFSGSAATQQQGTPGADGAGENAFEFKATSPGTEASAGIREKAKNVLGTASDRLADVGSGVREKAGYAKDRLASALESGAEKLREKSTGGALAGTTTDGSVAVGDGRVAQVSDRVAGGMDATAEWLREADLDSLKIGIERQVKEHPGRTLLIAVGLGYLIGRAFRSNNQ
jgi:hypothetical protein